MGEGGGAILDPRLIRLYGLWWYLDQILVTIEKLIILHIVAFMPLEFAKQLLSNFQPWKRKFAKQP